MMLERFSHFDTGIVPFVQSLALTGALGTGEGSQRFWDIEDVFTERTLKELQTRCSGSGGPEWARAYL
jgi:hypothetical protein